MKRAHFNGREARQVSLDDGRNRFFFFHFFFFVLMYKVCARALNVFIVIPTPKMHGFLLHMEILASVH